MRATNCDKSAETGVATITRTKERPLTVADGSMKNMRKKEREKNTVNKNEHYQDKRPDFWMKSESVNY